MARGSRRASRSRPSPGRFVTDLIARGRTWQAVPVRRVLLACAVAALVLSGCKGSGSDTSAPEQTPEDRLAAAKASFDAAEFIGFTLQTDNLPDGIQGLISAEGTGTHDPAFTGKVKVHTSLTDISAPLIAVDGLVYADLPFAGWSDLDPADYGAPDPADLIDPDVGISSLFTATEDATEGGSTRDGDVVLTTIDGTLPGEAVQGVFPSADSDDFDVAYTLTDGDDVDKVTVTGPFYGGADDVTYTIDLDLAADSVDIQAPS